MKKVLTFFLPLFFTGAILCLIEGMAGIASTVRRLMAPLPPVTARFDATMGWRTLPNLRLANRFGSGKDFDTNSFGLRETGSKIENGVHLVCSGDSFTEGEGIGDHETWCAGLQALDPSLKVANFGQAGFSPDQSLLLYQQLEKKIPHHVHLLAITGASFIRIIDKEFSGRKKPYVDIEKGQLVFKNYPVPQFDLTNRRLAYFFASGGMQELRSIQILSKLRSVPRPEPESSGLDMNKVLKVGEGLLQAYQSEAERSHRELAIIYLPSYSDVYRGDFKELRSSLEFYARKHRIRYWDMSRVTQTFSVKELVEGGGGHYQPHVYPKISAAIYSRLKDERLLGFNSK